jgi:hypothetical protein
MKMRNQAVLAETAARKLMDLHEGEPPTTEVELRDLVEELFQKHPDALTEAEGKALVRMSTLHRWEQVAQEEMAEEVASTENLEKQAKENGLEFQEYLNFVYLATSKANHDLTEAGEAELARLMAKSDEYLRVEDKKAADEIAKMREDMVRGNG